MDDFNLKKFLVENKVTSNSKIFEALEEEVGTQAPESITVAFNGDGFIKNFMSNLLGSKVYSEENFPKLRGDYGTRGLEMRKGYYYPVFRVQKDNKDIEKGYWYYIIYSGDEINIVQSSEHADRGVNIASDFNSLKNITYNVYCKFDKGVKPGAVDHRGYFKIV
jgi:hypothetical protein